MNWSRDSLFRLATGVAVACGVMISPLPAQEAPSDPPSDSTPAEGATTPDTDVTSEDAPVEALGDQIRLPDQQWDVPFEEHQPLKPVTEEQQKRRDALARFMAGRMQQQRREYDEALESYLQATELDPGSIAPYKAALPILLQRGRIDDAEELMLTAAEHNEQGYALLTALATVLASQQKVEDAISLMQRALEVPTLEDDSAISVVLHRNLGLFYKLNQQFDLAADQCEIAMNALLSEELSEEEKKEVLQNPGEMYDEFGEIFLQAERPEIALKAFDEASKYREAKPGLHSYNLAMVFDKQGQMEKALEELQKYFDAELQTRGRAAYDLLKNLLAKLEREDELLQRLKEMREQDPHNDVLRFYLADMLLDQGQVDEAQTLYLNGRDDVSDRWAVVGMISVARQQGDVAALLKYLTKAFTLGLQVDDEAVLAQLAPELQQLVERYNNAVEALREDEETFTKLTDHARGLAKQDEPKIEFVQAYLLGKLALDMERTQDAIDFYELAISMRNNPPAQLYTELGGYLIDAKEYEKAIEVLEEAANHPATAVQQNRWMFLYYLTFAREFHGDTERALEAIREAKSMRPQPRFEYQEAWVFYHAHRWDEAIEHYQAIIDKYDPDGDLFYPQDEKLIADCMFVLSNIQVEQGNLQQGIDILERVLEKFPENPQANNDLGYLLADNHLQLERAKTLIEKALEGEPENSAYLDSMGWVLYRLEDYEGAVEYLQKAADGTGGKDSTVVDHLGDALIKLGRTDDARAQWEKALEIEKDKKAPDEEMLSKLKQKLGGEASDDDASDSDSGTTDNVPENTDRTASRPDDESSDSAND